MSIRKVNRGFTLLEILIVVILMTLLTSISLVVFSKLNSSQALEKNTNLVVSILEEARSLTLSSNNASQYGVHLESSQIVLFKGASYDPSGAENVITPMNSKVEIGSINLSGGGTDIIFNRLTGNTADVGTLEISLVSDPTSSHTITVSGTGVVELN